MMMAGGYAARMGDDVTEAGVLAFGTVQRFWRALADDDDAAVRRLLHPATQARRGWEDVGLAASVRQAMGATRDACRTMGVSPSMRVLSDGDWAFDSAPTPGHAILITDDEDRRPWTVTLDPVRGWQLYATPNADEFAAAVIVELPIPITDLPPSNDQLN